VKGKYVAALLLTGAGLAAVGLALRPRAPGRKALLTVVETVAVSAADFYISLPVEGALEAARSAPIVNMASETQIVSTLPDGVWVDKGEVVMKLNAAELEKKVDHLQTQVAEAEERVRQEEAEGEKRVQNARGGLTKANEALELARVESQAAIEKAQAEVAFLEKELSVAEGQLGKRKRLLEERLVPVTEVEAAEDEVRAKTFALEAAHRSLERAQSDAETTKRLRQMDLEKAELELDQAEAGLKTSLLSTERDLEQKRLDLEEAQAQLDGMEVKAPVSGMLLLAQTWEDGWRSLRVGDRVWEGQRVANIIDPTEMWVRCDIDEADIGRVAVGQSTMVRVPAIGSQVLEGEVKAIDNLARQRSPWEGGVPGKKVFAAIIRLTTEEPKLRPGMGAAADIVLEHVVEGVQVPLEALFSLDDGLCVYLAEAQGYRHVPVTIVKRNNAVAAIEGDIRGGDVVACGRPPETLVIAAVEAESQ